MHRKFAPTSLTRNWRDNCSKSVGLDPHLANMASLPCETPTTVELTVVWRRRLQNCTVLKILSRQMRVIHNHKVLLSNKSSQQIRQKQHPPKRGGFIGKCQKSPCFDPPLLFSLLPLSLHSGRFSGRSYIMPQQRVLLKADSFVHVESRQKSLSLRQWCNTRRSRIQHHVPAVESKRIIVEVTANSLSYTWIISGMPLHVQESMDFSYQNPAVGNSGFTTEKHAT